MAKAEILSMMILDGLSSRGNLSVTAFSTVGSAPFHTMERYFLTNLARKR
jgi:hypothetical protein